MAKDLLPGAVVLLLLLLVAVQPPPAACELFSSASQKVCKDVECGKGECKASTQSSVLFVCECDAGWLQSPIDGSTDGNDFLPCVYPNCTLNLSCTENHSPTPPPEPAYADHEPVLDPCRWVSCGGGACRNQSSFMWSCECSPGFHNLNNDTAFPCFRDCALGSDCSKLGATFYNTSSPAANSPASGMNAQNDAFQIQHPCKLLLTLVLVSTLSIIMNA